MKRFNTQGLCIPEKHYMVDMDLKLEKAVSFIEQGSYFTINRPRQSGKTTLLYLLEQYLLKNDQYLPIFISFEGINYCYNSPRAFEAFHSVILAGVYDARCSNAAWNIAATFTSDLNFIESYQVER